jgi:hypothetical protein
LRTSGIGGEVVVDVDVAPAPGEGDVLLGAEGLILDKDHAAFGEGGFHRPQFSVGQALEIDPADSRAARRRQRFDRQCFAHARLPAVSSRRV